MTYGERASQSSKPKLDKKLAAQPAPLGGRLTGAGNVRLIFFGTEDFSAASLSALLKADWNICACVTKPDTRVGRGRALNEPKVKQIAKKAEITAYQPAKLQDIHDDIKSLKPTHGVLVSYGKIIPQSIIDLFPGGIINVHPSLLPKYRGPAPIEAPILNGDSKTGVSLMLLTAGMDEGPVYYQKEVPLTGRETKPELAGLLSAIGSKILSDQLSSIIDKSLLPNPQDNSQASYTKLIRKDDGLVDWGKPAIQLEREIRAYLGYPKSTADIHGHKVVITRSRIAKSENDGSLIQKCGEGWLEIIELVAPSGRKITGAEFILGYLRK